MGLQDERYKHFYLVLILQEYLLSLTILLLLLPHFRRHLFGAFVNMHIRSSSGGIFEYLTPDAAQNCQFWMIVLDAYKSKWDASSSSNKGGIHNSCLRKPNNGQPLHRM
jgi:hypothetical protein